MAQHAVESWVGQATSAVVSAIDLLVLVVIAAATLKVMVDTLRWLFAGRDRDEDAGRAIWLHYARWLVAALTLQLGADILESSVAPGWTEIAQLGAIALIRTFLNHFLERDIREVRDAGAVRTEPHAG